MYDYEWACGGTWEPGLPEGDEDWDGFSEPRDCDDGNPDINPVAPEVCNGVDDNCDGRVDERGGDPFWADADGDGFGDPLTESTLCDAPAGSVYNGDDCDDTDPAVHPKASETCDGVDNNCDGTIDEGCDTASGDTGTSRR